MPSPRRSGPLASCHDGAAGRRRRLGGHEMRAVHRSNGDRLAAILDECGGWPGHRLVGQEGSAAALLIAQHDIANPALMRRCRREYELAVESGDAEPSGLAYLVDRILTFEGSPQRYGTQVGWDHTGAFGCWPPVEDLKLVDHLRARLGMSPLDEAIDEAGQRQRQALWQPIDQVLAKRRDADRFAHQVGWRS